jgi:Flp pilus assembly protein TadG
VTSISNRAAEFAKARDGNVVVEFALIAPILLLMLAILFDFGMAVYDSMSLKQAARAGAQYAMRNPSDTAGIQQVVSNASDVMSEHLTVTTNQFCQCPDGTSADCGTTCVGGGALETYVTVAVTEPFATLLPYPASVVSLNLQGAATLRVH